MPGPVLSEGVNEVWVLELEGAGEAWVELGPGWPSGRAPRSRVPGVAARTGAPEPGSGGARGVGHPRGGSAVISQRRQSVRAAEAMAEAKVETSV